MGKIKRFLDFYRGRITYTEAMTMSLREFQALYYIMYKETQPADGETDQEANEKAALKQFSEELEDEL